MKYCVAFIKNPHYMWVLVGLILACGCTRNKPLKQIETQMPLSVVSSNPDSNFIWNRTTNSVMARRTGRDGQHYEFSMGDSLPFFGVQVPHITAFVGPNSGLHSFMTLENVSEYGGDSLTAGFGITDNAGTRNGRGARYVIKAGTDYIHIQAINNKGDDTKYNFTPAGIEFSKPGSYPFLISSAPGLPGQTLQLNATGDTAKWTSLQNLDTILKPSADNTVNLVKGYYNIISARAQNLPAKIVLPHNPQAGDFVEMKFISSFTAIELTGGKVASSGEYRNKGFAGNYLKFKYRAKENMWY